MKKIYTSFICLFIFSCSLFATKSPGFIITKDAKIITGLVANIFYSNWKTELVFINEMGRRYTFHPAVIAGFAIRDQGEIIQFESKYQKGKWRFLKVVEKGKLSLYRSPSIKTQSLSQYYGDRQIINRKVKENWLEFDSKKHIRVTSLNYKKLLRAYLVNQPDLLKKIGKPGYRYSNLITIVKEYNKLEEEVKKKI